MTASPGVTQLTSSVTSRFCDDSDRRSETRPRRRTLTVSGTGVVMTRSRGIRTSDRGAAKARSETGSRRGAETTNQTVNARNTERSLSERLWPFMLRLRRPGGRLRRVVGCRLVAASPRWRAVGLAVVPRGEAAINRQPTTRGRPRNSCHRVLTARSRSCISCRS